MVGTIKIVLFIAVMVHASCVDLKAMTVHKRTYILLGMVGLINLSWDAVIGLLLAFIPFLLVGLFTPLGGGDIKYAAMCGFVLQGSSVIPAMLIGILSALIVIPILQKLKNQKCNTVFPLVPFISFGFAFLSFF